MDEQLNGRSVTYTTPEAMRYVSELPAVASGYQARPFEAIERELRRYYLNRDHRKQRHMDWRVDQMMRRRLRAIAWILAAGILPPLLVTVVAYAWRAAIAAIAG